MVDQDPPLPKGYSVADNQAILSDPPLPKGYSAVTDNNTGGKDLGVKSDDKSLANIGENILDNVQKQTKQGNDVLNKVNNDLGVNVKDNTLPTTDDTPVTKEPLNIIDNSTYVSDTRKPQVDLMQQKLTDAFKKQPDLFNDPKNRDVAYNSLLDKGYSTNETNYIKGGDVEQKTDMMDISQRTNPIDGSVQQINKTPSPLSNPLEYATAQAQNTFQSGYNDLKTVSDVYNKEGGASATAVAASGVAKMLFGTLMFHPVAMAVNVGIGTVQKDFPEVTEKVMNYPTEVLKAFGYEPTSQGGKAFNELINTAWQMLGFHHAVKGVETVADKTPLSKLKTLNSEDLSNIISKGLQQIKDTPPDEQADLIKKVAEQKVQDVKDNPPPINPDEQKLNNIKNDVSNNPELQNIVQPTIDELHDKITDNHVSDAVNNVVEQKNGIIDDALKNPDISPDTKAILEKQKVGIPEQKNENTDEKSDVKPIVAEDAIFKDEKSTVNALQNLKSTNPDKFTELNNDLSDNTSLEVKLDDKYIAPSDKLISDFNNENDRISKLEDGNEISSEEQESLKAKNLLKSLQKHFGDDKYSDINGVNIRIADHKSGTNKAPANAPSTDLSFVVGKKGGVNDIEIPFNSSLEDAIKTINDKIEDKQIKKVSYEYHDGDEDVINSLNKHLTNESKNTEPLNPEKSEGNSGKTISTSGKDGEVVSGNDEGKPEENGAEKIEKPNLKNIITHPESEDSAKGIENSNDKDNPETPNDSLTKKGVKDAIKIDLTNHDKVYVSPNERATETLDLAKKNPDAQIIKTDLLKTGDISEYEGSKENDFPSDKWIESKDGKEFQKRMESTYKLMQDNPDAAFVTHSKVERAMKALSETDGKWTEETTKEFSKPTERDNLKTNMDKAPDKKATSTKNEPNKEDFKYEDKEMTKMSNAINDSYVEGKFGVEALDNVMSKLKGTDVEKVYDKLKIKIQNGTLETKKIIERIIRNGHGSDEDQAAILYDMAILKGREQQVRIDINESVDAAKKTELQKELVNIQNEMLQNALANRMIGRDWHNIGKIRQVWADRSANLANMMDEYQSSKGFDKLTKEQQEYVRNAYNKFKEGEAKVKVAQGELKKAQDDVTRLQKENEALKALIDQSKKQERADRGLRAESKIEKSNQRIQKSLDKLKELRNTMSAGVNPELAAEIIKIGKEKVYQGAVKFDEVAHKVLDEIKDIFPDFTLKDIKEHLTFTKESRTPSDESKVFQLLKRSGDLEDKIANKDYETAKRTIKEKSDKLKAAEADYAEMRYQWEKERRLDLLAKRPLGEKIRDTILGWQRFAVLSYPSTIAKLMSVVGHGLVIKPFRFALQKALYHGILKPLLGDKAPAIWGKPYISALGKYYSAVFRNFALANLRQHFKGIDIKEIQYGKKFQYDEFGMQNGWMQIPGRSHGYIKSFIKNAEFAYANEQISRHYIEKFGDIEKQLNNLDLTDKQRSDLEQQKNQYDVTSADVQDKIGHLSVEHGKWAILMNDNRVTDEVRNLMDRTGWFGALLRSDMPIVKIPLNFVGRVFATKYGIFKTLIGSPSINKGGIDGHPGLFQMMYKGTDYLTPEKADLFARTVNQASIGVMFYTAGFLLKNQIKENDDGSWELFGHHVSKVLVHLPEYESIFSGAKTAQYMDKDNNNIGGFLKGIVHSDIDVLKRMPYAEAVKYGLISNIFQSFYEKKEERMDSKISKSVSQWLSGMTEPGFVQEAAKDVDAEDGSRNLGNAYEGKTIKRTPSGTNMHKFMEQFELGIPGLRENVQPKEDVDKQNKKIATEKAKQTRHDNKSGIKSVGISSVGGVKSHGVK